MQHPRQYSRLFGSLDEDSLSDVFCKWALPGCLTRASFGVTNTSWSLSRHKGYIGLGPTQHHHESAFCDDEHSFRYHRWRTSGLFDGMPARATVQVADTYVSRLASLLSSTINRLSLESLIQYLHASSMFRPPVRRACLRHQCLAGGLPAWEVVRCASWSVCGLVAPLSFLSFVLGEPRLATAAQALGKMVHVLKLSALDLG